MKCGLVPFYGWCLENFPFIENDFDALTDYELMCKVVEYVKNIATDLENIEINYNEVIVKLDELYAYTETLREDVTELQNVIGSLESDITTMVSELQAMDTKVNQIDLKVNYNTGLINSINTTLSNAISDLENELDSKVSIINGRIDDVEEELDKLFECLPKYRKTGTSITFSDTINYKMPVSLAPSELSQETNILPDGYTQVDYIESNGTQCIDTEYQMTSQKEKVEIRYSYTALGGCPFGSKDTNNLQSITPFGTSNVGIYIGSSSNLTTKAVENNTIYNLSIEANNGSLTTNWDGIVQTATYTGNIGTQKIGLFSQINNAGTRTNGCTMRCYNFKIFDNDLLKINLIPCYRNSDNEIGMYDLVNNQFYTNIGTGTFTKGSVLPTPTTPIPVNVITGDNEIVVSNSDNTLSQTKPLNLGDIEYCKKGNYGDNFFKAIDGDSIYDTLDSTTKESLVSGKWYIQKNIGKYTFTGNEQITADDWSSALTNLKRFRVRGSYMNNMASTENSATSMCNFSMLNNNPSSASNFNLSDLYKYTLATSDAYRFMFWTDKIADASSFKTFLTTIGAYLYYTQATPTYILLNDTLQEQIEDLYNNSKSFEDATNITQTNADLPFIITATVLKKGEIIDEV